jgi:hypothetical protein
MARNGEMQRRGDFATFRRFSALIDDPSPQDWRSGKDGKNVVTFLKDALKPIAL